MKKLLFAFMKYYAKGNITSFFVFLEAIIVLLIPVILIALSMYFYLEKTYELDIWLMNTDNNKIAGRLKALIIAFIFLIPTTILLLRQKTSIREELNTYMGIPDKDLLRLRIFHYIMCALALCILTLTIYSIY